ncbi:hypothetical protein QTI33_32015 [Variovorax sp. J22P271]|uniref:hypothetical protein n=1 Tax=Variovorax davisae TaxID=3053515 RepID=UPI00257583D0|nr:hypothetical protein [Variovorax sp. J22P271]MDM0036799.1 hypothetical protein [Variovorax sp. J22P271]
MPQDLDKLLGQVKDEASFRTFVAALAADFAEEREIEAVTPSRPYGPGALGWEHGTIDEYLGAAAACGVAAFDGDLSNPWLRCAAILYGGKVYE